jgi:hypothetical protein
MLVRRADDRRGHGRGLTVSWAQMGGLVAMDQDRQMTLATMQGFG